MYKVQGEIKGLVAMMHNRFFEPEATEPGGKRTKSPEDRIREIELKLHMDAKRSRVIIPADNLRMMLIGNTARPGAAKILGTFIETGKGTKYIEAATSSIWVLGTKDPLRCEILPTRKTFDEIDERPFNTQKGKGGMSRKIQHRPLIKCPWKVPFIVHVTDDNLSSNWVRDLFKLAGLRCGLGAYGPTFGRFEVTRWRVEKKQ